MTWLNASAQESTGWVWGPACEKQNMESQTHPWNWISYLSAFAIGSHNEDYIKIYWLA